MARLWARIIKKHRIEKQATAPGAGGGVDEALTELCREFEEFSRTAFLPEHFMEDVPFQRLEI